jgi:hypothetical protein
MILKVFLGGVSEIRLVLLVVVGNAVRVDVVAANPSPMNPKPETSQIPIVVNNARFLQTAINLCCIDSS